MRSVKGGDEGAISCANPPVRSRTEAEVRAAAPAFRAMRAAGPHGEPWFEEMLDEIGVWIDKVDERPGSMLVAAYA
jgi:hypothetical protein